MKIATSNMRTKALNEIQKKRTNIGRVFLIQ